MTEIDLLEVIAKASRKNATFLDLSRQNIKTIPLEIANLTKLTSLILPI
jgi:Leucine-rich repeat (LRR) protein